MRVSRVPFLALAIALMLTGLWAGLVRLGWAWPPLLAPLPMAHGPLMVGGFLGALISLERAIALGGRWPYGAPVLAAVGAGLTLAGVTPLGPALITLASLLMVVISGQIVRIHVVAYAVVIALGSVSWLVGNLFWLTGFAVPGVVYWWAGFLILTIAGERLELSRFLRPTVTVQRLFIGAVALQWVGMALTVFNYALGSRVTGLAWVLLALWLLRYDIARRRVRAGGQARYMALALLAGYGWMAVGGVLALLYGGIQAGPHYDALLHTVFVGFVFSMIFAHSLIIFPVVLGVGMAYHPRVYVPLALLHAGLLLRVVGDLLPWWEGRLWGGLLSAIAVLAFLATTVASLERRVQSTPVPGSIHAPRHSHLH